jgi:hypothetical protein
MGYKPLLPKVINRWKSTRVLPARAAQARSPHPPGVSREGYYKLIIHYFPGISSILFNLRTRTGYST